MSEADDNVIEIEDFNWKRSLEYRWDAKSRGMVLAASLKNATLILCNDEAFKGCWRWDDFRRQIMLYRPLPSVAGLTAPGPGPVEDHMLVHQVSAFSEINGLSFGRENVIHAIEAAAHQDHYNSLVEHLDGLEWDGTKRIHGWLYTYLGAEHTQYTSAVGRWWLVSAMARAYKPGCQADHMLVLEGPQGAGKSTASAILGGAAFLSKLPNLRDYDRAAHALAGRWIVEVGELDAMRGAAATQAKEFISLKSDNYRAPYARFPVEVQRTCVFIGTTNEDGYLVDVTGGRRYHPVRIGHVNRQALTEDRDQLLAEAREAFKAGEQWWPDEEHSEEINEQQEERYKSDEWESVISRWLDRCDENMLVPRDGVSVGDILFGALELAADKWDDSAQKRAGNVMKRLGWRCERKREGGARVRRYFRP